MNLREAAERLLDDMDRRFAISPADATRLFITYGHWEAITEQLRAALEEPQINHCASCQFAPRITDAGEVPIPRWTPFDDRCRKCGGPIHPNFPCEEVAKFDPDPTEKRSDQTDAKPVAWRYKTWRGGYFLCHNKPEFVEVREAQPLYLHPQDHDDLYAVWKHGYESAKAAYTALTDDEIHAISRFAEIAPHQTLCGPAEFMRFARAVERAILDRLGMQK